MKCNPSAVVTDLIQQFLAMNETFEREALVDLIISQMRASHPDAWEAYVADSNRQLVTSHLRSILAQNRLSFRRGRAIAVTEAIIESRGLGRPAHYAASGRFATLRSMTKAEVMSTAQQLELQGRGKIFQAAVLRKIAKKLATSDSLVSDFWTDEQLAQMLGNHAAISS